MTKKFRLVGLECANCAAKMEKEIKSLDGVVGASVNHLTEKLIIDADEEKIDAVIATAEKIVKKHESHVVIKKA